MVQPNKESIVKLAESLGKSTDDLQQLYEEADTKQAVLNELIRFGKANGLTSMEVPHLVRLCAEVWTPQNKLLTATLKTSRAQVCNYYRTAINEMYKELKLKFPTKWTRQVSFSKLQQYLVIDLQINLQFIQIRIKNLILLWNPMAWPIWPNLPMNRVEERCTPGSHVMQQWRRVGCSVRLHPDPLSFFHYFGNLENARNS